MALTLHGLGAPSRVGARKKPVPKKKRRFFSERKKRLFFPGFFRSGLHHKQEQKARAALAPFIVTLAF